jgi:hypothetical protein
MDGSTPHDSPAAQPSRLRAQAVRRVAGALAVAVRELRLLFGLLLILFVTSEVWRYAGRLEVPRLAFVLFSVLVGAGMVIGVGLHRSLPPTVSRPIWRRAVLRVLTEVSTFGVLLCLLFSVLGFVTMDYSVVQEWSGAGPMQVLLDVSVLGQRLTLTPPLLQVSACLGALGSLVFAIEAVLDDETRAALLSDLIDGP